MSSMDIIFAVLLGVFIIIGIWKGFFREVLGFTGIVGGIFVGIIGFGPASKFLSQLLPGMPAFLWPFLSFIFIFIAVYLSSRILAGILSKISEGLLLGWLNRLLGGLVGGLKGAILLSLILLLIGFLPFQSAMRPVRESSRLYDPLQRVIPSIYNMFSDFNLSSRTFENKLTRTLGDAKVKLTDEMINYLYDGKQDSTIIK